MQKNINKTILILAVLSVMIRIFLFNAMGPEQHYQHDTPSYFAPAQSLIENFTFVGSEGPQDIFRTPGYPAFIAILQFLTGSVYSVIMAQNLLGLLMAYMAWRYFRQDNETAGNIAFGLVAFNFLLMFFANTFLTEVPASFLTLCTFFLLLKGSKDKEKALKYAVAAAIMAGITAIVRPIAIYLCLPSIIFILLCYPTWKNKLVLSVVFVAVFSIIPISWSAQNYQRTGQFAFSSIEKNFFLSYMATEVLSAEEGRSHLDMSIPAETYAKLTAEAEKRFIEQNGPDQKSLSEVKRSLALETMANYPMTTTICFLRNTVLTFLGNGTTLMAKLSGLPTTVTAGIGFIYTIPALILALTGLVCAWRKDPGFAVLAFLFTGYFVGTTSLVGNFGPRFRMPVEPVLCILISYSLCAIFKKKHKNRLT
ncbi:glycosyltransferase family 39 protein [Maridesulfovibrio sp.]|uniref:glycosyltransferase family 39 protein n=1 Tax=Maridesulfovibrio sp. TaxID=2795000 RepID=UPI0029F5666B|nr:glycosyltransferase family 39 protein [Maridesulfovibrio sp.]